MSAADIPVDSSAAAARTRAPAAAYISWVALALMTTSSVASLRSAPTMAVYGLAAVFLYIVPACALLLVGLEWLGRSGRGWRIGVGLVGLVAPVAIALGARALFTPANPNHHVGLGVRILRRLGEAFCVAAECGDAKGCILPDVYHLYKGGSDFAGLGLLSSNAIGIFHVNDYPRIERDKIVDADRVYPGDGIAPLKEVFAALRGHTILGRTMAPAGRDNAHDQAAFAAGLARSGQKGGLLHHLFGAGGADGRP